MAQSTTSRLVECSRITRQNSRAKINAVDAAMAESREIIATSKKLLMQSHELHDKMEHQQRFIIDPAASVYFVAATFHSWLRN